MDEHLIYDVGLHNGDDTAFYLSQGYRVVAVEAAPDLVAHAETRFAREIADGRLTIEHVAVGREEGTVQFWISDENSEWSSLHRPWASRSEVPHQSVDVRSRSIDVRSRPFAELLREHGLPYYLKIDIEGADRLCIDALTPDKRPRYVSIEFGHIDDLIALRDLGYNAFKVIHQHAGFGHRQFRAQPPPPPPPFLRRALRSGKRRAKQLIPQLRTAGMPPEQGGAPPEGRWSVEPGPSGPFGEMTDGTWLNFELTAYDLLMYAVGQSQHGDPPDWHIWFDVHATTRADVQPLPPLYD